jgi:hypothetical protein
MNRAMNFGASFTAQFVTGAAVIHVRFAGQSFDLLLASLGVGTASTDAQIKRAVAEYLNVSMDRLADYAIDRHENGNLTMRPEAVFG